MFFDIVSEGNIIVNCMHTLLVQRSMAASPCNRMPFNNISIRRHEPNGTTFPTEACMLLQSYTLLCELIFDQFS